MGKRLKTTNVDDLLANTNDVASIFYDFANSKKKLTELEKENEEKQKYEWVYKVLERYGNVFVNTKIYSELDESRLGNYSLDFVKKNAPDEKDGYVIWKI
jgi:hypothetical protein